MSDLLGSILGSMQGPPTLSKHERKRRDEQKKQVEKQAQQEKDALNQFKTKTRAKIQDFAKNNSQQKLKFDPTDKVKRAIIHEIAEIAGLASYSFGDEGVDRYIMLWKREFAPCEDELAAVRRGEEWSEETARRLKLQREAAAARELSERAQAAQAPSPCSALTESRYKEKYERLIGREAGKQAADTLSTNKAYGFVSSENKKDVRTIEQVMADNRARKKLKTDHPTGSHQPQATSTMPSHQACGASTDSKLTAVPSQQFSESVADSAKK